MDASGTAAVERERSALMGLAYRMLGTVADAEDAVQEAFLRWYRLTDEERAAIVVPGAWLMRTASRICLDTLGSARARRESYVGEWLPEPVPSDALFARGPADPLDRAALDESVSTALLLLLETLTPAERVVLVLHDVFAVPFDEIAGIVGRSSAACRQLASSGRRRIREGRRGEPASRERHDELVQAFAAACASGSLDGVVAVLDAEAVLRSDGGGFVSAALRPVRGAENVARFVLGLMSKWPDAEVLPVVTPDGLALAAEQDGTITTLVGVGVADGRITDVWIMRNPHKLTLWTGSGPGAGAGLGAADSDTPPRR